MLRTRCDVLSIGHAPVADWRRLRFEAVSALVSAQRAFVQLHGKILGVLGSDRLLYNRLRIASLELTIAINELHALVRHIDRTAASN